MQQDEIKSKVQRIVISSPCSMGWNEMEGGESLRFCHKCNLNVHNISALPDAEIAQLVDKKESGERTCMFMSRTKNGRIITDNCPTVLRPVRNAIRAFAAAAALTLIWSLALSALAQGLGTSETLSSNLLIAPVDPSCGQSNEIGMADFGYDSAKKLSQLITLITFSITWFVPLAEHKKRRLKLLVLELIGLAIIPMLVHLAGTFFLNNFGGMGGGGI